MPTLLGMAGMVAEKRERKVSQNRSPAQGGKGEEIGLLPEGFSPWKTAPLHCTDEKHGGQLEQSVGDGAKKCVATRRVPPFVYLGPKAVTPSNSKQNQISLRVEARADVYRILLITRQRLNRF